MLPSARIATRVAAILATFVISSAMASLTGAQSAPSDPSHASARASAYVPLDDNAYAYANALIARGRLRSLSQIERPYRVDDFRRAMALDTGGSRAVQALVQRLNEALVKYDVSWMAPDTEALRISITPYLLATAQTSGRRELMLADSISRFRPGFGGVGVVQMGRFVAGLRAYDDSRLKDDPEFIGQKNNAFAGRMEDAYLSTQMRFGEIFFGRIGRNWGPSQLDGLLLGHSAYTYDHLYVRLGVPQLHISSVVTRLDDGVRSNTVGGNDTARRYFSVHQVTGRVGRFEAAVSEAVVYGGHTENFRLNYINPLTPYILSQVLESSPGNNMLGLDLAYRSRFGVFQAQGLLDDFIKDHCAGVCQKPNSFGYTVGAEDVPLHGDQRLFASYTMVANLTYRNEEWYDSYTSQGVGLGRGYADYDEARLGADLLVIPGTPLRAYIAYRRQGEGDYRLPHPVVADYPLTRQFLSGVVQHTTRYAVSGAGSVARYVHVTGDVGYNHVSNAAHISGVTTSAFEGRVQLTIESPWSWGGAIRAD